MSLFKLFPFAFCGEDDKFEHCFTSLESRATPRKLLDDGDRSAACEVIDTDFCVLGSPDDAAEPGYFSTNLVCEGNSSGDALRYG